MNHPEFENAESQKSSSEEIDDDLATRGSRLGASLIDTLGHKQQSRTG